MHRFNVSAEVFSRLWALRRDAEQTEDQILRRLLDCPPEATAGGARTDGLAHGPDNVSGGDFIDATYGIRFAEGDEEIAIRVQAKLREAGMAALRALELRTPSGAFVPLEEVAKLSERQGFSSIQRIDGNSSVSVTGDVDLTVTNPGAVLDELRESGVIGEIASRYGVSTGFSGRGVSP